MSPLLAPGRMMRLLVVLGALALALISVADSLSSGQQATSASLNLATAAAPIPGGGFYIADAGSNVVDKVSSTGEISAVAGTGDTPQSGAEADATGPATSTKLSFPTDAVPTSDGGILIASSGISGGHPRIRKVTSGGTISTVAGAESTAGCVPAHDTAGNGCPATQAVLSAATAAVPFSVSAGGGFLIAEWGNGDVRKVDSGGTITKVAGGVSNTAGTCDPGAVLSQIGDGCPATQAILQGPSAAIPFEIGGAAVATPGSGFLITEEQGCRVRFVNGSGVISTVAGQTTASNSCRSNGDPVPPDSGSTSSLKLSGAWDARPTATAGVFLLADGFACVVRRVDTNTSTYTTPTKDTQCESSIGITAAIPSADGNYLVADASQVKQSSPDGSLTTVAGSNANSAPPVISGTPKVGETLSCSQGTWNNSPDSFAYKWSRDGSAIPGATGTTYVVADADAGHALTCTVTATNSTGGGSSTTASATSSPVNIPAAGTPPGGIPPGGGGTPPPPKASCTFTKRSGVVPLSTPRKRKGSKVTPQPKNTLAVTIRCNQAARVTIRGTLKQTIKRGKRTTTKLVTLTARTVSVKANVALATTLKVPASAVSALKHGTKTSGLLTLAAVNANGVGTASAPIAKLSTKN